MRRSPAPMVSNLEDVNRLQEIASEQLILALSLNVTRQQKTVPSVGGLKDQRSIVARPAVVSLGRRSQNLKSHLTERANISAPQGKDLDTLPPGQFY